MNRATKCWSCGNWDNCYKYLYGNKKQEYMKKIDKIKDEYGDIIIRVFECDNFKNDKNFPKNPIFDLHNPEIQKIDDIIDAVEDYFYNSGQ